MVQIDQIDRVLAYCKVASPFYLELGQRHRKVFIELRGSVPVSLGDNDDRLIKIGPAPNGIADKNLTFYKLAVAIDPVICSSSINEVDALTGT